MQRKVAVRSKVANVTPLTLEAPARTRLVISPPHTYILLPRQYRSQGMLPNVVCKLVCTTMGVPPIRHYLDKNGRQGLHFNIIEATGASRCLQTPRELASWS